MEKVVYILFPITFSIASCGAHGGVLHISIEFGSSSQLMSANLRSIKVMQRCNWHCRSLG